MLSGLTVGTLLPASWFAGMNPWLLALIALVGMVVVIFGAEVLVAGAAGLARKLGMPEVVVGATIVSLGTTSPEMAVSVMAAWGGNAGLALGNGVGSIIADTGLIFGLGCVLAVLPADRFVLARQGWVQFGVAALLAGMCYGLYAVHGDAAVLGRGVGAGLLVLLVGYLVVSVRWAKQHPMGEPHLLVEEDGSTKSDHKAHGDKGVGALLGLLLVGLAMVVVAGDGLVQSVSEVAIQLGMPKAVVAATLVALGTSLPELVVGITAIRRGHPELLVGNVIGADILNVLFVIGAAALAKPLPIVETLPDGTASYAFLTIQVPTMLAMLVLFRLYIFRAGKRGGFEKWMGWPLLVMYFAFIALNFLRG
ncbi:MAG: sodium:calcium antiporter [Planctomycetota bacterium]